MEIIMDKSKGRIPKQCRIGDTCLTSLETIGGNLFTINPKNINHVHRNSNDLLSVIIILGTNVHGGETVFNYGKKWMTFGKYHMFLSIQMEGVSLMPQ